MKKILLLTFIGSLFASVAAFGHCGSCGVGDEAHAKGEKSAECAKACDKAACDKAACEKACCAKKEGCTSSSACEKPCTKKPAEDSAKAADESAAAMPAGACCPAKKAAKPA